MSGSLAGVGVRAEDVSKSFGSVVALRGIDLEVPPGTVTAVLGPNGAGKSTLLRIIGTTVLPDAGAVVVAGIDAVADPEAARARMGLVLGDERAWYWRLSGRENLEFFGILNGLRRAAAGARADVLLQRFGLAGVGRKRVDGYSSGMRARLSLCRALTADPPVLLLDEPTRSLDPQAALEFREMARQLVDGTSGRSVLIATHDLHEAAALADQVLLLSDGSVVQRFPRGTGVEELEASFALLPRTGQHGG